MCPAIHRARSTESRTNTVQCGPSSEYCYENGGCGLYHPLYQPHLTPICPHSSIRVHHIWIPGSDVGHAIFMVEILGDSPPPPGRYLTTPGSVLVCLPDLWGMSELPCPGLSWYLASSVRLDIPWLGGNLLTYIETTSLTHIGQGYRRDKQPEWRGNSQARHSDCTSFRRDHTTSNPVV